MAATGFAEVETLAGDRGPVQRSRKDPEAKPQPAAVDRWPRLLSWGCLLAAVPLWLAGLPRIDPEGLTDYGIVSILPWQIWLALGFIAVGFSLTLTAKLARGPLPYLHLLALILMLHATPAIAYGTLRYSWAWKHIGIVDFIQRHGTVDRFADFLPAYHNWPGLFLVSAWIANALQVHSLEISNAVRFTPAILTPLFVVALTFIYRRFTDDPRVIVAASWIFVTGNWVGQDYYSPQGTTYLFYLTVVALCLGPLRRVAVESAAAPTRLGRLRRFLASLVWRATEMPLRPIGRWATAGCSLLVTVLIIATTATHQLTPIALFLSLAGLAAIGRLSWSYCILALVVEIGWLLYAAAPFVYGQLGDELYNVGEGIAAASNRLVDTSIVSAGRVWVVIAGRILTVGIGLAAAVGGLRRLLGGFRDGPAIVLTLATLPLFGNTYGGEILFRVYLFALPFLSFFAAAMFFPRPEKGRWLAHRAVFAVLGFLAAFGFLMSNNGKDRQYSFTRDEVATANWLYSNAPPDTLLIEGSRGYPSQFRNYENFVYLPISEEKKPVREKIIARPGDIFASWLGDAKWQGRYVVITASQKAYSDAEGIMPPGSLDDIERALLASSRFVIVKASPHARIFTLHPTVGAMGPWADADIRR